MAICPLFFISLAVIGAPPFPGNHAYQYILKRVDVSMRGEREKKRDGLGLPQTVPLVVSGYCCAPESRYQSRISSRGAISSRALTRRMVSPFSALAPLGSPPMPMGCPSRVVKSRPIQFRACSPEKRIAFFPS